MNAECRMRNAESARQLATNNWQLVRRMLKSAAEDAGRGSRASLLSVALRARYTLLLSRVTVLEAVILATLREYCE